MLAIRTANITAPMSVPEVKTGSLNRRRFTAGTCAVSSRQTNSASATSATDAAATMSSRLEPVVLLALLEEELERREPDGEQRDAEPVHVPPLLGGAAAAFAARMSSGSCTKRQTMKRPSTPTGRLMKKIHDQW